MFTLKADDIVPDPVLVKSLFIFAESYANTMAKYLILAFHAEFPTFSVSVKFLTYLVVSADLLGRIGIAVKLPSLNNALVFFPAAGAGTSPAVPAALVEAPTRLATDAPPKNAIVYASKIVKLLAVTLDRTQTAPVGM